MNANRILTIASLTGAGAPSGYPARHHLTKPIRAAAAAAGDSSAVNLWAGTGFRAAGRCPSLGSSQTWNPEPSGTKE
ncbi:hypothetical protein [Arthrobacter caoxuetaonis]|uniref:hypothetical protein n=1 Tax=Arthrobacter caoxuetaonis TaxID=2886935 RepID=UPI003C309448